MILPIYLLGTEILREETQVVEDDSPEIQQLIDDMIETMHAAQGCLSIPDIHEIVSRPKGLTLRYHDRTFTEREESFGGMLARVIQHEYDHVDGVLFIDHLSAFKRRLLKRRLQDIREGHTEADYTVFAKDVGVIEPEDTA